MSETIYTKPPTELTSAEAARRLAKFGPNLLSKPSHISFWKIAKTEIAEPMILLLIFVGVVYSLWGKLEDAITIFAIILCLVLVEVWNEFRAKKAIDALSKMSAIKTRVWRDGKMLEVPTEQIVPGDILLISPGTKVAADATLISALGIQADESTLTGESAAVFKNKSDAIMAGTLIVAGEGRAQVTATGAKTQFGKIALQAESIKPPRTPLQIAMKKLTGYLVWVAIFFSVLIPVIGILRGDPLQTAILTGLALSFATIPEEGPIIVTMVLGLGAYQLSKQKFLVKKLKAAETLGDATVILTDKTGTLTENNMHVTKIFPNEDKSQIIKDALALQSEASPLPDDQTIKRYAEGLKIKTEGQIIAKRGFSDQRKTKSALQQIGNQYKLIMIGAPEEILAVCSGNLSKFKEELAAQTANGRRVIAVAGKNISHSKIKEKITDLERDMQLQGLIIIEDPARIGVQKTLEQAAKAGIRTIMVTGDHPQTASYIAKQVGINSDKVMTGQELAEASDKQLKEIVKTTSVFARSTPQDKYRLLKALQSNGEIVAVTGDGVNDTLALKGANVGVAMGIKGTDAAKEAADAVLADDNYSTIANAIFQGRKFFDNLRKGFQYYLSVKLGLILIFLLPIIIGLEFPFAPIQIILLELFMDLAASWAFVAEPAEPSIFWRKPHNPNEQLINRPTIIRILLSSLCLVIAVWGSYFYAVKFGLSVEDAKSFAFAAWVIGHIILAFISRSTTDSLLKIGFLSNKAIVIWAVAAIAFLIAITSVPAMASALKLTTLSLWQIGSVGIICFVAIGWLEILKDIRIKKTVS